MITQFKIKTNLSINTQDGYDFFNIPFMNQISQIIEEDYHDEKVFTMIVDNNMRHLIFFNDLVDNIKKYGEYKYLVDNNYWYISLI